MDGAEQNKESTKARQTEAQAWEKANIHNWLENDESAKKEQKPVRIF